MAKKKSAKSRGRKKTPSTRKRRAGAKAARVGRGRGRRTAGARTPQGKARRKKSSNPPGPGRKRKAARLAPRKAAGAGKRGRKRTAPVRAKPIGRSTKVTAGGTGREQDLAQTPETGRTVRGLTNPMPTKRSTGTPSGAGSSRRVPALDRARRQLREVDETVPSPPSSLDPDRRHSSAVASGRKKLQEAKAEHTAASPALTGGDVDADWEDAYAVGDEAPGGDNPTPDQDRVDDIGKALGVQYDDNEELKGADKIAERDRHRWELDPASSDDYQDRD